MSPDQNVTVRLSLQMPVTVVAHLHNLAMRLETTPSLLVAELLKDSFAGQLEIDQPLPAGVNIPDACSIGDLMQTIGVAPVDP